MLSPQTLDSLVVSFISFPYTIPWVFFFFLKKPNNMHTVLLGLLDQVRYVCCYAQSQTRHSAILELQNLMSSQNPSLKVRMCV